MTTMTEDQLIKRIKTHIEKGDQAKGKAEQHYVSAGIHLRALRDAHPKKAEWEKLIRSKCGLGASRAYELIQIANGRKTVAELRLSKAESVRKLRSRPLRSGQPAVVEPEPEPEHKSEPVTAAKEEKLEIMEVGIEHLASRLIDWDRDTALELHSLLYDGGHGVFVLTHALGRGLKGHLKGCGEYPWIKRETEPAPSAPAVVDDGLAIPDCLLRVPKDVAA
jgi:hypothetical protein